MQTLNGSGVSADIAAAVAISLLGTIPSRDREHLVRIARMVGYERGEWVAAARYRAQVGLVVSGHLQTFRLSVDGSAIPLTVATSGRLLTPGPLFGAEGVDASAVVRSRVAWVRAEDLRRVVERDARATFALAEELNRLLDEAAELREVRRGRSLQARVAEQLLVLADLHAGSRDVFLSHEMLAFVLGSRREVVTRVLGSLSARGLVALSRGRIRLLDHDRLRALCELGFDPQDDSGRPHRIATE
jgi:CRP-like cAMP-binding protein